MALDIPKQLRKPTTTEEKDFAKRCYKIGMKNPWCSGKAAFEDGDFIVEEDRLNKGSFCVADSEEELKEFFKFGNWCLGQAIIYKDLCFIQQVNGGDEWLTIKDFEDGAIDFESMSWELIIEKHGDAGFSDLLGRLLKADKDACVHLKY